MTNMIITAITEAFSRLRGYKVGNWSYIFHPWLWNIFWH